MSDSLSYLLCDGGQDKFLFGLLLHLKHWLLDCVIFGKTDDRCIHKLIMTGMRYDGLIPKRGLIKFIILFLHLLTIIIIIIIIIVNVFARLL